MATTTIKTLTLKVLRPADFPDCTNGGASAEFDRIEVIVDDGFTCEVDLEDAPRNLFRLEVMSIGPTKSAHLVPVRQPKGVVGPMAGGNYATISDSRWGSYVASEMGPEFRFMTCLPIHDRFETQEMYDALCR